MYTVDSSGTVSGAKDYAAALEVARWTTKYRYAEVLCRGSTNDAHNHESAIFVDSCFMVNSRFDPAGMNGGRTSVLLKFNR